MRRALEHPGPLAGLTQGAGVNLKSAFNTANVTAYEQDEAAADQVFAKKDPLVVATSRYVYPGWMSG